MADSVIAKPNQPDYTKGEILEGHSGSYWSLGPIGATGYFWADRSGTEDTRQVLIKPPSMERYAAIEKGSPADGVLREHDVILGVGREPFASDPRRVLAQAITEAEKQENRGKLVLLIWRPETELKEIQYKHKQAGLAKKFGWKTHQRIVKQPLSGETMRVELTLPVMGNYSETTPWDCPKTKAIIDRAAQSIIDRDLLNNSRHDITKYLAALGLLATGEAQYLPMVRAFAHEVVGDPNVGPTISPETGVQGPNTWTAAYQNVFLAEYYLATKDEHVLPYIKILSTYIARGRSGVGTWSHGMSYVQMNGLYGPPSAYGAMNQCSITAVMSLVLAQKCGIDEPEINQAVEKAIGFLRWFVHKGTIPYGDHAPAINHHDSNGKNSQAAVLFDLYGDKEAADYFTRMTLASYRVREQGHTGHYFGMLWGALGAARGGPEAAQSFIENIRYFTELERRFDGSSIYQHQLGGSGNKKTSYWDTSGQRLLQHCLPRKQLYIIGKGGSNIAPIIGDDLKNVVAAATFDPEKLSVPELLGALGSWSVVVREQAAEALGHREDDVVKALIAMLGSPNPNARYGACVAMAYAGRESSEAVQALVKTIENDNSINMRYFAIRGLEKKSSRSLEHGLKDAVLEATPALLKVAVDFDTKQDPHGKLQAAIASIMLYGGRVEDYKGYFPNGNGLEKVDHDLVIASMKAWLKNPNGGARTLAATAYDQLSQEQLDRIWPEVYYAAKYQAPSGVMFSTGGQGDSIILLSEHKFAEGLPLAADFLTRDGWGRFARVPRALEALSNYGAAAKPFMPSAQKEWDRFKNRSDAKKAEKHYEDLKRNLDNEYILQSIKPYLKEQQ